MSGKFEWSDSDCLAYITMVQENRKACLSNVWEFRFYFLDLEVGPHERYLKPS